MKGRSTFRRSVNRCRIALGRIAGWKFILLLIPLTLAVEIAVTLPLAAFVELDPVLDPGRAARVGWFMALIVTPLVETLTAQTFIVWLVSKIVPRSFRWPVIASGLVFGSMHWFSWVYMLGTAFVGILWAFAYKSRLEKRGFASAFGLTALVHAGVNALAMLPES